MCKAHMQVIHKNSFLDIVTFPAPSFHFRFPYFVHVHDIYSDLMLFIAYSTVLKEIAPEIGTNVNFWGSVFLISAFKKNQEIIMEIWGSLGLFWSYNVLNLTFLHLNYF
jgi:hypothetical protein